MKKNLVHVCHWSYTYISSKFKILNLYLFSLSTSKMRPFQVVFLIVTSACTVQAACEKITDCRECLSFRCVWYELPNKSICGNNIIPKFSFTTKIRNAALCPRKYKVISQYFRHLKCTVKLVI